ncbi:MAG: hypothetical protein WEE66_12025 [Actinomycetota bacterium]
MPDHFDQMRDDVEFALAGASAHLDEILGNVSVMIEMVENPAELERVREQMESAASAIESVAARFSRISEDGIWRPA